MIIYTMLGKADDSFGLQENTHTQQSESGTDPRSMILIPFSSAVPTPISLLQIWEPFKCSNAFLACNKTEISRSEGEGRQKGWPA